VFVLDEPQCRALEADLSALVGAGAGLEAIAGVVATYASPSFVRGVVNLALRPYAHSLDEGVLFRNGLVSLINGADYALDLRYGFHVDGADMLPAGREGALLARAADVIIANAGSAELPYCRYEIDKLDDFSCFDRNARLRHCGSAALQPGEWIIVRGGREVASLDQVSGARFLSLCLAPRFPIDWVFDRSTLAPIAQSVAHVDDSQLITCLEVAEWLKSEPLRKVAEDLTDHPAHFVRWKAVQALSRIDPQAALPHIHAAIEDRHPSVRAAAARTLGAA
jgi:hypothetical protein